MTGVQTCALPIFDVEVPANAEIIIEGVTIPTQKVLDGPFGEFPGNYITLLGEPQSSVPVIEVTAITMRKPESRPINFPLAVHTMDELNIDTTIREAAIFELCERLQPGIIQDVHIPYAMTDWGGCIIQVKKRNKIEEGWQRNFLGAILACSQGMRLAIAVSEDTDIYSMDDVMWCLKIGRAHV